MIAKKIKSFAKINLALNVIGKTSNLHNIESIIAFISLYDDIFIKEINSKKHKISFTGKFSNNIGYGKVKCELETPYDGYKDKTMISNSFNLALFKVLPFTFSSSPAILSQFFLK